MKWKWILLALVSLLLLVWAFAQAPAPAPVDLARLIPPSPLLYLEAKDFGGFVRDWHGSQEKNGVSVAQAQTKYAAAAGLPPNMDLLTNAAGRQTALAIYDIGRLESLYVTRLSSDRFA